MPKETAGPKKKNAFWACVSAHSIATHEFPFQLLPIVEEEKFSFLPEKFVPFPAVSVKTFKYLHLLIFSRPKKVQNVSSLSVLFFEFS